MTRRKRARVRRRNPAGGFLPGVLGFFLVPMGVSAALRVASEVTRRADGSTPIATPAILGVSYLGGAVAAWAGSSSSGDPGWGSFLRGGAWGSVVSALLVPALLADFQAEYKLPSGPTS